MELIFIKYLLVPLIAIVAVAGFALYAKLNKALRPGRLLIFLLITALLLAVPALTGLMTYEFVPFGLVVTQVAFLILGFLMVRFMKSSFFNSIGLENRIPIVLAALLVSGMLGAWVFYLVFEYLGGLSYTMWVTLTIIWFFFPVFYQWASDAFLSIQPAYYKLWDPIENGKFDESVWENADYLRMMNISLRIKKSPGDPEYSTYPVRAPAKVPVSQWFTRYIKDQRIKFPNSPIETEGQGEPYCWIFYTTRFLIFNRAISPEQTFEAYRIRNKSVIYARRVDKMHIKN
jgi:hypothetical protein